VAFATPSYVSGKTLADILTGTDINLTSATFKVALFTDAGTAGVKDNVESYAAAPYNANEVTSANYTAGGLTLTGGTTLTAGTPAGRIIFDDSAATRSWSNVTWSGAGAARGALVYADSFTPKRVVCAINFGSDRSVTAGTFTITWDATNGIFYATY
jgi:hypothetical protein